MAIVVFTSVIAIGFVYTGLYDVGATSSHSAVTEWLLDTTMHQSVARRAEKIDVPGLTDRELQLAGINDFDAMCVECHTAPGAQPSAMAKGLNPAPPDLSESAAGLTASELFWVTKHGIKMTGMPAWGQTHSDKDLWAIVAFMQELPILNSDGYEAMLKAAKGKGHHGPEDTESNNEHIDDHDDVDSAEPEETGHNHNHGGHDH